VTAPFRFPRFFVTSPAPCPYLPGRQERKVFTELGGSHAGELNDALGRIGFRRSQSVADRFVPGATQRKLQRRMADLEVSACRPWATDEQFDLLQRYLATRHPGGGMAGMDEQDYADMVEHSPVRSFVIEYREPSVNGRPGKLVGACITDQQADGLSMIYSFYDSGPDARPGLGTFIILDHIARATAVGLPYVYLGYWVKGSARMEYKARFQPLEVLTAGGWRELAQPAAAPVKVAEPA
jgi:arginine-tRNA-protein transferase